MAVIRERLVHRAATAGTVVLLVLLTATTAAIFKPRLTTALGITPPPPPAVYPAGAIVDVPAAWYADAPHTLVVFARESCAACQKAAPFLTTLVARARGSRVAVVFAAAGPDVPENRAFAAALGVPESAFHVSPRVRARATPTLVLVTQQGVVVDAWEGVGPEAKQALIAASVDRVR